MTLHEQMAALEAVLYVSGDPVSICEAAEALSITEIEMVPVIELLERHCAEGGLRLIKIEDKLQLATKQEYAAVIEKLLQPVGIRSMLSQSVLETLAIIAYKQPVTRHEIEQIRGVQSDYSVSVLLERQLIQDVGRKDTIGRPILYGTTDRFLRHFGIEQLSQLPQMEMVLQAMNTKIKQGGEEV